MKLVELENFYGLSFVKTFQKSINFCFSQVGRTRKLLWIIFCKNFSSNLSTFVSAKLLELENFLEK